MRLLLFILTNFLLGDKMDRDELIAVRPNDVGRGVGARDVEVPGSCVSK